jgi:hypothetical protein
MAQVVEGLPSKHKTLSTGKKKKATVGQHNTFQL